MDPQNAFPPPPDPKELLRSAGLSPKKSWGQNFLCDSSVLESIAEATGCGPEAPVVELGAGLGALTYYLAIRGGPVVAVERDREIAPILRRELSWAENLTVQEADAARIQYGVFAQRFGKSVTVAGNLPYQLSGRILGSFAEARDHVCRGVFLVQREVAQRMCAQPGSKTYGLLSVLVQRAFDAEIVRGVAPGAFLPPPKVHSSVVLLERYPRPLVHGSDSDLVAVARAAFSQRRKTLRNALRGGLKLDKAQADQLQIAFDGADLDSGARAETLGVLEFARLAEALRREGLLEKLPKA